MKTIYKYRLDMTDFQQVSLPKGAEILCVQSQHNIPNLWALVDTEQRREMRQFEIFGTGHEVKEDMGIDRKYIGTFQLNDGNLVFHVFERL